MTKPKIIYMHKTSGDIKICRTDKEGQALGADWTKIQFVKNDKGERVMRFKFDGLTIDVQPNGTREVVDDGNGNTK